MHHDTMSLTGDEAKKFTKHKVGAKVIFTVTGHLKSVSVPIKEVKQTKEKSNGPTVPYDEEPRVEVHILSISLGGAKLDTKEEVEREIKRVKDYEEE